MKTIGLFALFVLFPFLGAAQTAQTDSYELRFYQGGAAPVTTYTFVVADVECDLQPIIVPIRNVNPTRIQWADPDRAGRSCLHDTAASTTELLGLPVGTWEVTLVAINEAGDVGESGRSAPFSRINPPAVLTEVEPVP